MDKTKIKKKPSNKKEISINIKITKHLSEWLKNKEYSPTGIFIEACKELGYKK